MKLIITRHGETSWNKKHKMQGTIDSKLSSKGVEEAKKLAERLKNEHFDRIYSSPLSRALVTAEAVARFHPDVSFEIVEDLRERDLGEFEGKMKKEIGWYTSPHPEPRKGEYSLDASSRAGKFLGKLLKSGRKGEIVLIVAHKHINCALVAACVGADWDSIYDMSEWKNTSMTIIDIERMGDGKIVVLDDVGHLE